MQKNTRRQLIIFVTCFQPALKTGDLKHSQTFPFFQDTYQKLLPLYFPRSLEEEKKSLPFLPVDIGNAEGEPVVPERQIRISEKPGVSEGEFADCVQRVFCRVRINIIYRANVVILKAWGEIGIQTITAFPFVAGMGENKVKRIVCEADIR